MQDTLGIDVSKNDLAAHALATGEARRFANDRAGIARLARWLIGLGRPLAVFESTGSYTRALEAGLAARGLPMHKVNALRAHRFAESCGRPAKTDRVDAAMLARMGKALTLCAQAPAPANLVHLKELLTARRALARDLARERGHAGGCVAALLRRQSARRLRLLEAQLAELDAAIEAGIAADPGLARRAAILRSIPGIGPVAAAALTIDMPELGSLSGRQAASMAGVAPIERQSGQHRGQAHIGGGRPAVRRARLTCRRWRRGATTPP